mgnify:CR=1 FL=1
MSVTIKSEKALEDFLNLGLNPTPIVIAKGGYYSVVNYSNEFPDLQYKNVLNKNNIDFLRIEDPSSFAWNTFGDIDFEILIDGNKDGSGTNAVNGIFLFGVSNTNGLRLDFRNTGNTINMLYQVGGSNQFAYSTSISQAQLQGATLKLQNGILYLNGNILIDASSDVSEPMSLPNKTVIFGGLSTAGSSPMLGTFYNIKANIELFGLNEPSGFAFTGSLGTTGTRNTSAADPLNYVNTVMIQPI